MKDGEVLKAELNQARAARDSVRGELDATRMFATPKERLRWLLEKQAQIGRLIDEINQQQQYAR